MHFELDASVCKETFFVYFFFPDVFRLIFPLQTEDNVFEVVIAVKLCVDCGDYLSFDEYL